MKSIKYSQQPRLSPRVCQTRGKKIREICRIYPREERVVGIGNNNIFVIKGIIDYVRIIHSGSHWSSATHWASQGHSHWELLGVIQISDVRAVIRIMWQENWHEDLGLMMIFRENIHPWHDHLMMRGTGARCHWGWGHFLLSRRPWINQLLWD